MRGGRGAVVVANTCRSIPLSSGCADMVITSPPYYNAKEYAQWNNYGEYLADMEKTMLECFRVLKDGGRIAVNVPQGYGRPASGGYIPICSDFTYMIRSVGFELRGHIVWVKGNRSPQSSGTAWGSWRSASNPSLRDDHEMIIVAHKGSPRLIDPIDEQVDTEVFLRATLSVWNIAPVSTSSHWHPASFPIELVKRLILLYTQTGALVIDPFSGSGTVLNVATILGRHSVALELKPEYARRSAYDLAADALEWEKATRLHNAHVEKGAIADLPLFSDNGSAENNL